MVYPNIDTTVALLNALAKKTRDPSVIPSFFSENGFSFVDPETLEPISTLQQGKLVLLKENSGLISYPGQALRFRSNKDELADSNLSLRIPSPFSVVIEPEHSGDKEFWLCRLEELVWEDPGYQLQNKEDTGQLVLLGRGELHLEIGIRRIRERTRKKTQFQFDKH